MYTYILIRNDLSSAQKAVQSCHAAIEASRSFLSSNDEHPHLVILVVKNENKLKKIAEGLTIKYKPFVEPDMDNQWTAIATEPISGHDREQFKRFQLLT